MLDAYFGLDLTFVMKCNSFTCKYLEYLIHQIPCRKYGLDDNTVDFIGHALALHRDDNYLKEPALDTVKRMKVTNSYCLLK